jgi:hypothetical protein
LRGLADEVGVQSLPRVNFEFVKPAWLGLPSLSAALAWASRLSLPSLPVLPSRATGSDATAALAAASAVAPGASLSRPWSGRRAARRALRSQAGLPTLPAFPSFGRPSIASLPSLPGLSVDNGLLLRLSAISLILAGYGAAHSGDVGASSAAAATAAVHASAPATHAAAKPASEPALDDAPFSQHSLNVELRTLRSKLESGESARNLMILGDGTMGATVVSGSRVDNLMAQNTELVREPLGAWPAMVKAPELELKSVHGIAPTRVLDAAQHVFHLPLSQLASLKLQSDPKDPASFIWTGVWNAPAVGVAEPQTTTLYADQDAKTVTTVIPR